jgi:hypothetical protein
MENSSNKKNFLKMAVVSAFLSVFALVASAAAEERVVAAASVSAGDASVSPMAFYTEQPGGW